MYGADDKPVVHPHVIPNLTPLNVLKSCFDWNTKWIGYTVCVHLQFHIFDKHKNLARLGGRLELGPIGPMF